jgi:acyl carrier protein
MTEAALKTLVCDLFLGGDTSFPIDAATDLLGEGICDSLGLVQLAGDLEARVPGLRILDQEVTRENMGSLGAIAAFIAHKTA